MINYSKIYDDQRDIRTIMRLPKKLGTLASALEAA